MKRYRDGIPVVDADATIVIFVSEKDIGCATPGDPCACAVAQAVKRTVGDSRGEAEILRRCAYVKAPDEDGNLVWTRYLLSPKARRRIETFDKTGYADPAGYRLMAPCPALTLDRMCERSKKRREARPDHVNAIKRASRERRKEGKRNVPASDPITLEDTWRNGAGQVHHSFGGSLEDAVDGLFD